MCVHPTSPSIVCVCVCVCMQQCVFSFPIFAYADMTLFHDRSNDRTIKHPMWPECPINHITFDPVESISDTRTKVWIIYIAKARKYRIRKTGWNKKLPHIGFVISQCDGWLVNEFLAFGIKALWDSSGITFSISEMKMQCFFI